MEQEACDILSRAVSPPVPVVGFAQKIHQRCAAMDVDELPILQRSAPARPAKRLGVRGIFLDTNVLSELMRPTPPSAVLDWFDQ